MVAAGITLVRFGEFSWSWYEPQPGCFDFAAMDRFVDLVEARGLRLCLCTPTATPPPWFDRLFPDGRLQDMQGRRCLAARHFWSWNHSGSWQQAKKTITRLARRYGKRSCLWGWQIDNEPNYAEELWDDPQRWYDWNPHAVRDWITWLQVRYGRSLDRLNTAWFANFWSQRIGDWDELRVPRGKINPQAWLDWLRWREENLANQVRAQARLVRRWSPHARIGCNIPEAGVGISLAIGQDYWAQARAELDWVGTDLYEATGRRERDLRLLAYRTDVMRSAAGTAKFIISETQAGPHERAWPNAFAGETWGCDYLRQSAEI
jgi:beta-galactosidase